MSRFDDLPSVKKLRELSENPTDLTKEGALSAKRIEQFSASGLGLKMLFATERVTEEVLDQLFNLARETDVFTKMKAMQNGEIINKIEGYESEDRAVLHTAMRDFFENPNSNEKPREATRLAYQELEKLKNFLDEIEKENRFTDLIQIGIGGSDLGPRAIYLAMKAYQKPGRRVHFISNVDPDDAIGILSQVDLSKTLIVVVSKSGTTLETLTNEMFIRERLKAAGITEKEHLIAVTGKGSPMDNPERYRASFYIWDYIGGRYSVTSMVGAVTLAFAVGMEKFLEFLRGANLMDKMALKTDPRKNLPLLSALLCIWNRNFLGHHTRAIIPYSQAMLRFTAHMQQCDMESNGKQVDKQGNFVNYNTGPIIWGEPGTNGQHSFYQLLHQGTTIVPIEFIGFKESQFQQDVEVEGTNSQEKLLSNLFAQVIALATGKKSDNPNKNFPGNRPSRVLFAQRLDPQTLGLILSYFEHTVAFQGFIWNINSFDQEGVQLGKVLAKRLIEQFARARRGEGLDSKSFPAGVAYIKATENI
ncbi:MAG: glucose-6-phosphate isomerase [Simkaniaceae bacterium]